ncbi:signal peptide peptidase SppA [Pseudomaricurvus sp. HS19]|uniref:signal peptide peptidase SppA n=1 Tax=Pseudomaricurvus sp. HS19 TaxID=2692626 RepID=UPI001369873D|nr:signal peptide peptidase SppA [Pseudomaricurvus sp. HS19]MYM65005.1 signal peptide peptidase SppA [Pseudomaricurvus sp. HS19]
MSNTRPGPLRRTISWFWRAITWIRVSLANLLFLVIIAVIVAALWPGERLTVPEQTALRLAPTGFLVDQYSYVDPLTQILERSSRQQAETRVRDLVEAINKARDDQRVTGLVLDLSYMLGGGLSKLQEVGRALENFKTSGKPVYAIGDTFTQEQYYLASYADQILLHPMGAVILTGYSSYRNYFRAALEKLEVNMHVFRVGEYKDAVEPYLRDDMSDASREHNAQWLGELWSTYTDQVESQRKLPGGRINDYINQLDKHLKEQRGDAAATAQALGLVDELADHHQQLAVLQQTFGSNDDESDYQVLDYEHYLALLEHEQPLDQSPQIGLLVASGMILDGEQPAGSVGSSTISQLLENVRESGDYSALVVRVDSPGGSAFASEIIRKELELTRKEGIPVFISMGSVAASGGYWMSMAADEVWATPTTITGSIGVFSAFPTVENTLQKVGIGTDGVGTTELSGALRIDRPLNSLAAEVLQQSVNHIYDRFLTIVADARQTTTARVNAVGQGRVWTGRAALDLGLVDQLGDLQQVIKAAADKAGLEKYQVVEVHMPLSPTEQLLQQLAGEVAGMQLLSGWHNSGVMSLLQRVERELAPLADVMQMADPRAVYARCLECVSP